MCQSKKLFELFQDYFSVNKNGLWEEKKYVLKRENDDDFFIKKYNISSKNLHSKILESLEILRKLKNCKKCVRELHVELQSAKIIWPSISVFQILKVFLSK